MSGEMNQNNDIIDMSALSQFPSFIFKCIGGNVNRSVSEVTAFTVVVM